MTAPSTTIPGPDTLPGHAISGKPGPSQSPNPTSGRAGMALAAACVCQLMVVLDISVVNVALPDIGRSLGFSSSSLSWVVSAYTLTFGGLLLLGGRIADLIGHRRTMLAALALFGIASVLGGLTHSPGQLIAARAAQGMTAAVLSPLTLTVIMVSVPEGPQRRRALATWGMVATGGSALGVLLSGLLTQYLDWRWVLFVNVPFVLVAATLALIAVRDLTISKRVRLDVVGAILATASTTLLAYGCVYAGEHAWDNDGDRLGTGRRRPGRAGFCRLAGAGRCSADPAVGTANPGRVGRDGHHRLHRHSYRRRLLLRLAVLAERAALRPGYHRSGLPALLCRHGRGDHGQFEPGRAVRTPPRLDGRVDRRRRGHAGLHRLARRSRLPHLPHLPPSRRR